MGNDFFGKVVCAVLQFMKKSEEEKLIINTHVPVLNV